MTTGGRAFADSQPRGGNYGVPRNLDRLNWRDHRPLDNPQGGPPRVASDGGCAKGSLRPTV